MVEAKVYENSIIKLSGHWETNDPNEPIYNPKKISL